jgi:hypothetical protein
VVVFIEIMESNNINKRYNKILGTMTQHRRLWILFLRLIADARERGDMAADGLG